MTGYKTATAATGPDEEGGKLRIRADSFADHYSQARMFFRSMDPAEQAHIASAIVFELSKVGLAHVRTRMLGNLVNVDGDLAQRVADGLNMDLPAASEPAAPVQDLDLSPALRIVRGAREPQTLEGKSVGILIADGSDADAVDMLTSRIGDAGGKPVLVAPKVGGARMSDGSLLAADGQLAGSPSVMFDAVVIALSAEGCEALLSEAAAVQFVMDAFGHLRVIGHGDEARPLLDKAGVEADEGVVALDAFVGSGAKRIWDREPKVRMLA